MQDNISKRNFTGFVKPHHNHTCHPPAQNVITRFHNVCWVKPFKIIGLCCLQSCKRPLTRGKPRVKSVRILLPIPACRRLSFCYHPPPCLFVFKGRNSYSPTNLS